MTSKERVTRAVEHGRPDRIPARVSCLPAVWKTYRDDLRNLYQRFAWLDDFAWHGGSGRAMGDVDYDTMGGEAYRAGEFTDNWGTTFHNASDGHYGQVKGYPLEDWSALDGFRAPDPILYEESGGPIDWEGIATALSRDKGEHYVLGGGDRLWERMWFLRGMERLMIDMVEGRPEVERLRDLVVEHNVAKVRKWLDYAVDGIHFGDDWGAQGALLINPTQWRTYFKPAYAREFALAKGAGKHTWLHSDGCILDIIPDLIEIGLDVINPQIGANGLENLARVCNGNVAVDLDLDRQGVLTFGTPRDIRRHIQDAIDALGGVDGGLLFRVELNPPVPFANIEATFEALAELCARPNKG